MKYNLALIFFLCILSGCRDGEPQKVTLLQCVDCHDFQTDPKHKQACTSCHGGTSPAADAASAHLGSITEPAHPDQQERNCGPCHESIIADILTTSHFTLTGSTNLFRTAFGAAEKLDSFRDTPLHTSPESPLQLADDLLRRRCFRCHPYSSGDNYPQVSHGTGCGSCHMAFLEGKIRTHLFIPPGDEQCLSCHYGNYVGFDYYGRFEHDFNLEYRTPFTTKNDYFRPYGVEYHQLQPDVHQLKGMLCIDCHRGSELMSRGQRPSCEGCHSRERLERSLPPLVTAGKDGYTLSGRNGKRHPIPLLQHPAHFNQADTISCQACHAQWTFNDIGKHFFRSDSDDFEPWSNLSVQGYLAVERLLEHNNDFDNTELPPQLPDLITGELKTGIWYKGYTMRRWESVLLGRDELGRISPMRPLLDYSLTWLDAEENVRFDAVSSQAPNQGLRSYVPHTTGPAGLFYRERLARFKGKENETSDERTHQNQQSQKYK